MDNALTEQLPFVKALFRMFSGANALPGDKKPMCSMTEWQAFVTAVRAPTPSCSKCMQDGLRAARVCEMQAKLLSKRFTIQQSEFAFCLSNMTTVSPAWPRTIVPKVHCLDVACFAASSHASVGAQRDEIHREKRAAKRDSARDLTFTEFLEALCRCGAGCCLCAFVCVLQEYLVFWYFGILVFWYFGILVFLRLILILGEARSISSVFGARRGRGNGILCRGSAVCSGDSG